MSRQIIFTTNAGKPPATYSQTVKAAGLIFVSGTAPAESRHRRDQGHDDSGTDSSVPDQHAGYSRTSRQSLDKNVSATVILADEDDFAGMNENGSSGFRALHLLARAQSCPPVSQV